MKTPLAIDCHHCESRDSGVFCQLSSADLDHLSERKISNRYKKGQMIFYEDNQPFGLYCINAGRVKLYKNGFGGRTQILRIAGPGDVLGYRSLFAEETYHASAEALEECHICFIDKNVFFETLVRDPVLARNIIRKLSKELRGAEELATSIAQRSARERMAELILSLKELHGESNALGTIIQLQLSREEVAEMIGITQETAIRLLSEFNQKGWIQLQGREITVTNEIALKKVAHVII